MDLNITVAFVFMCLMALGQGFLTSTCADNSGCSKSECCATAHGSKHCYAYQQVNQPCHRPNNTHVEIYHCGCAAGLICEHFNLDPTHQINNATLVHGVEGQLEQMGFGLCVTMAHTLG